MWNLFIFCFICLFTQVIKFTSCLSMVGGSHRVLRLLPPLKTGRHDIAESGVKHNKSIKIKSNHLYLTTSLYYYIYWTLTITRSNRMCAKSGTGQFTTLSLSGNYHKPQNQIKTCRL